MENINEKLIQSMRNKDIERNKNNVKREFEEIDEIKR